MSSIARKEAEKVVSQGKRPRWGGWQRTWNKCST